MTRRYYNYLVTRTRNLGDQCAAPLRYIKPQGEIRIRDLRDPLPRDELRKGDVVIFGGGGMLHGFWNEFAKAVSLQPRDWHCVVWGAGHNKHDGVRCEYPKWLEWFDLVGVRDYERFHYNHVPCASCLAPEFDVMQMHTPARNYVLYEHCDRPIPHVTEFDRGRYPFAKNTSFRELSSALYFLAQGETVVTTSYHGAYWAALLGRRVIVYPWSSKFLQMPYKPMLLHPIEDWHHVQLNGKPQMHLEQARKANRDFWVEVKALIGSDDD